MDISQFQLLFNISQFKSQYTPPPITPTVITPTTNMMKSGLGQKEKLKALRMFVDNHDVNNRKLCENVHIEKQIKYFEQSGLNAPCELLTMHSATDQERQQRYYFLLS